MPISFARSATILDFRPDSSAVTMPLAASIFSPSPSRILKAFISSPRSLRYKLPSVNTPSTSKMASRMRCARAISRLFIAQSSGNGARLGVTARSDDLRAHQIVRVQRAHKILVRINYQQLRYLVLLHEVGRFRGKLLRPYEARIGRHQFVQAHRTHVASLFQGAPQIAIGENAEDALRTPRDGRHSHAFLRDFENRLGERCGFRYARHRVSFTHDVVHMGEQAAAQAAAG